MSDNNKKNNVRVIKSLLSLVIFLICFLSTGCCFAKDKIRYRYLVNNSDVMFYNVAYFLCTSDYNDLSSSFSAVKLKDGRVLITGGIAKDHSGDAVLTNKTLIYDPKLGKWGKFKYGPDMYYNRFNHESILLPDGRVFIYGGTAEIGNNHTSIWDTTEFYDPDFNTFIPGPNLIIKLPQKKITRFNDALFADDKKEYLYIVTEWCTNLFDVKNDKIYNFDPIRPHKLADEINSEYKGQTEGTDTIIGFENKTLEKDLVKRIKLFIPFVCDNNISMIKLDGIIPYKDDLYYLIDKTGNRDNRRNTILLYNAKTKEKKEITKMASYRDFTRFLKLKNNKVLIWGKDYDTRKYTYELFDMKTQKIKTIDFHISDIDQPVVLDDDSILWMGILSQKGQAYILKFKEGVL